MGVAKLEVTESRVPGTLELTGVAPAGQKHGTAVAAGLIWEGPGLRSKMDRRRAGIEDISPG